MKKKKQARADQRPAGGHDQLGSNSDFYSSAPSGEQPLYEDRFHSSTQNVRKTSRHQAGGRKKETVDPREKMALVSILKLMVMMILLLIAFFMLWKGIKIYEETQILKTQGEQKVAPVLQHMDLVEDFDVENKDSRELFAERVESWKEATRLVRSAEGLIQGNNPDQAISRCQEALRLNPAHLRALELLGGLYFMQEMNVEAINAYIRLLNVDPSRSDIKVKLIEVLNAHQDANAVIFMTRWYQEEHDYDGEIQRHLANALFFNEEFAEAIEAYNRVLLDDPGDSATLEKMADAYMYIENYADALITLQKLQKENYRDQMYYRKIVVCHAQLGESQETVQTLGKAAHLFGQQAVISWMQDPRLDPVREDRSFQAFADRVGGEEFRKWLEKVAQSMEGEERENISPQLTLPKKDTFEEDLLRSNK